MADQFFRVYENGAKAVSPGAARRGKFKKTHLEVRMFNVGDGEAIALAFPGGRAWLVDGGSSNSTPRNQRLGRALATYLKEEGLVLEALVPSHPHVDHVGAVAWLLQEKPPRAPTVTCYRSEDATWHKDSGWLKELRKEFDKLGSHLVEVPLKNAHREVAADAGVEVHLFAGSGEGAYTSIFLQLRFGEARLLFTGDSHCQYELELLERFGEDDFRADVLKVTHHGSSSGTAKRMLEAVKPGMALVSSAEDAGHLLEADTLERLGGYGGRRRLYETVLVGDIILRTDGGGYGNGVLYQVETEAPGRFAGVLEAGTLPRSVVDAKRSRSNKHPKCR